ncbi:MAG: hypothetical protein DYG88_13255 [Chloroflexi bacterium CFX4]|nr:hypothetical protein [Chloroflexi bacterium CFX4]MDL1923498.1 hypothetical protein [Chloroflexi bacterium CFX3]
MSEATRNTRTHLHLSAQARSLAPKLLDQQLWCWGCDIRRAAGNLLLAYGFLKLKAPTETHQSSAYTLCFTSGAQITLWAFGVFYGAPPLGGIYLKRGGFAPRYTSTHRLPIDSWCAEPPCRAPATPAQCANVQSLLSALSAWIADYEAWVVAYTAPDYRAACVAAWFAHKRAIEGNAMVSAWHTIAEECRHASIIS